MTGHRNLTPEERRELDEMARNVTPGKFVPPPLPGGRILREMRWAAERRRRMNLGLNGKAPSRSRIQTMRPKAPTMSQDRKRETRDPVNRCLMDNLEQLNRVDPDAWIDDR